MTRHDCHQHVWPGALLEVLRSRTRAPYLDGDVLHLVGEPPFTIDRADHDLADRRLIDQGDGCDLALLSLSSPLGIEHLPADDAAPLLAAWHDFADELGAGHGLWASVNLVEPDLEALAKQLVHSKVAGLQVPATALADPTALERLSPVLAVVEDADRPVLVHPGPAPAVEGAVPAWWPALAAYPAQQAAAWFAWHEAGRSLLPRLRIAFVALAGLAPLHHERLAQRGGRLGAVDAGVYYETSSYGAQAIDAVVRVVGVDAVVHGTDRPYATPSLPDLGDAFTHALLDANPHHLLNGGIR